MEPSRVHEGRVHQIRCIFSVMAERMLKRHTKNVIFDISGWALWHRLLEYVSRLVDIAKINFRKTASRFARERTLSVCENLVRYQSSSTVTKAKIKFVSSASATEEFAELSISLDLIPARYGGNIEDEHDTMPWVWNLWQTWRT